MARKHAAESRAGDWLKRLLLQLVSQGLSDVSQLGVEPDHAIHRLRVRMKKADALLRLGRSAIAKPVWKRLRQHLKNAKNACSGQRDAAVLSELARELAHDYHLTRILHKKAGEEAKAEPILKTLARLQTDLVALNLDDLDWKQVFKNYGAVYRSAKVRFDVARETGYSEAYHDCRKLVKVLHHQTLALAMWLPHPKKRLKMTRKLGKLLGRDHDLAVLGMQPATQTPGGEWKKVIERELAGLRESMIDHAKRLFEPSVREFALPEDLPG